MATHTGTSPRTGAPTHATRLAGHLVSPPPASFPGAPCGHALPAPTASGRLWLARRPGATPRAKLRLAATHFRSTSPVAGLYAPEQTPAGCSSSPATSTPHATPRQRSPRSAGLVVSLAPGPPRPAPDPAHPRSGAGAPPRPHSHHRPRQEPAHLASPRRPAEPRAKPPAEPPAERPPSISVPTPSPRRPTCPPAGASPCPHTSPSFSSPCQHVETYPTHPHSKSGRAARQTSLRPQRQAPAPLLALLRSRGHHAVPSGKPHDPRDRISASHRGQLAERTQPTWPRYFPSTGK